MKQLYGKNNCTADSIKFFNTAEVNYVMLQMKARLSVTTKLNSVIIAQVQRSLLSDRKVYRAVAKIG